MKLKTKRRWMLFFLLSGIIWNVLCIFNVLPIPLFKVSIAVIGGYSFIISFGPLFFPGNARTRERSAYIHDLEKNEKRMSYATIGFSTIWIITLLIPYVTDFSSRG